MILIQHLGRHYWWFICPTIFINSRWIEAPIRSSNTKCAFAYTSFPTGSIWTVFSIFLECQDAGLLGRGQVCSLWLWIYCPRRVDDLIIIYKMISEYTQCPTWLHFHYAIILGDCKIARVFLEYPVFSLNTRFFSKDKAPQIREKSIFDGKQVHHQWS